MSSNKCSACAGSLDSPDGSTLVCTSCGLVQHEQLLETQLEFHPDRQTSVASEINTKSHQAFMRQTSERLNTLKLSPKCNEIILSRLQQICALEKVQSGNRANILACGVVFITLNEFNIAKTVDELVILFEVAKNTLARVVKQIQTELALSIGHRGPDTYLGIVYQSLKLKMTEAEFGTLMKRSATVLEIANDLEITKTCPASIAAASVLVAYSSILQSKVQIFEINQVARKLCISKRAISDRMGDINKHLKYKIAKNHLKPREYYTELGNFLS